MLFHYELQRANMYVVRQRVCVCIVISIWAVVLNCTRRTNLSVCIWWYTLSLLTLWHHIGFDRTKSNRRECFIFLSVLFSIWCIWQKHKVISFEHENDSIENAKLIETALLSIDKLKYSIFLMAFEKEFDDLRIRLFLSLSLLHKHDENLTQYKFIVKCTMINYVRFFHCWDGRNNSW